MPRLQLRHLWSLNRENRLLPLLLRATRNTPSARTELRWLREYAQSPLSFIRHSNSKRIKWKNVIQTSTSHRIDQKDKDGGRRTQAILRDLCLRRSKGEPLQYILGTQPFGNLEILCRPGVLIPRSVNPDQVCFDSVRSNL